MNEILITCNSNGHSQLSWSENKTKLKSQWKAQEN